MNNPLDLAKKLIAIPSVTPEDGGCQQLIIDQLVPRGFESERFDCGKVRNTWIRRGETEPLLVFVGHTDVVPPGDESAWRHPPFDPVEESGLLYGRGSADMKGSVAAMTIACQRFARTCPGHRGSLALLITSDEEGVAIDGIRHVVRQLQQRRDKIDWCVVGEPSAETALGDTIKHGRRGSLNGRLTIRGRQGHVAYPQRALNPIHAFAETLNTLCREVWDQGNTDFPPTALQVAHIHAGVGADNVIPGKLEVRFNFRFSTENNETSLRNRVERILNASGLDYELDWHLSGQPFLTPADSLLVKTVREATTEITGITPRCSTAGGTSDGRFIAPTGAEVVEIGPVSTSIHEVDEHVRANDLETLAQIYLRIMEKLLAQDTSESTGSAGSH